MPADLKQIAAKVESARRLDFDDGLCLAESRDIHEIGRLANLVRERWHGRRAYYNINRHINYTNYCVLRCKFCSFYRPYPKPGPDANVGRVLDPPLQPSHDSEVSAHPLTASAARPDIPNRTIALPLAATPASNELPELDRPSMQPWPSTEGGYELTIDEIVARARDAAAQGATEVHIVGGLHPKLPFDYYLDMCGAIRDACPQIHIKAFTAIEIIHFTRITRPRRSIRDVLVQLREAGLGSLPGGGAEIFDDRVHDEAYKAKVGEQGWFDVHRTAHELGIYSNATMLYGHVETPAERVRHLIKLREHQDQSLAARPARFNCCIPLSFIPEGSELADLPGPTGLTDLRTLALARLMLDNVPHIKAFWPMQSARLAQVSLNWGVDDFDGTVVWYDITKREGGPGRTHQELAVDRLRRLITEAGCRPVERDTLYRPVTRTRPTRDEPVAV